MLQFYLAAAQFVLGDLPAPTTASGKLTPAIRAQEQLGWRLGLMPPAFVDNGGASPTLPVFETIDKTAELGLLYVGGSGQQTVSREIPKNFDGQLNSDELRQVRLKLDAAGVRLPAYSIGPVPSDEAGCRKVFEFVRQMGIETIIAEPPPEVLDAIERLCDEYDINLAISGPGGNTSPNSGHPQEVLKLCNGRGKRIGACANLASWIRRGIDPIEAIRMLRDRVIILQVHDLNELTGISAGKIAPLLEEIYRLGVKPTMFSVEYMPEKSGSMPGIAQSIDLFNKVSIQLVK
jgi:sugar phosphate isomerase/epimerase